ncbi:MAG: DUF2336 domain-containing protein [Alphaproteobacteria bacterium]|nr:DUF2336 domain-containing protein [Alphaproteobacteria bacterium]
MSTPQVEAKQSSEAGAAATKTLIGELEVALQSGSTSRRTEMLRRVTDYFFTRSDQLSPDHLAVFDEVMSKAVVYIEGKVRAELSERLAPLPQAPDGIIRRLANDDDIEVAGPVLEQSERLSQKDLVEIAKAKGPGHLLKISGRNELGEAVTDVLVERGDTAVRRTVAGNIGARFSETGFSKLVIYAEEDEDLAATVAKRADIPPLLLRHVLSRATDTVRERLLAQANPDLRNMIRKALKDVSSQVSGHISPRQYAEAQRRMASLIQDTALTKQKLREFATTRRVPETVVALSALSGVPIDLVDHLVNNASQLGVMSLCRAIGIDWPIVAAIILARIAPEDTPSFDVVELNAQYNQLSVSSAQRVLRFWQVRQEQDAATGADRVCA